MKNHKLSKLLLASVISSLTVPTFAQQLEEVVVTASKRADCNIEISCYINDRIRTRVSEIRTNCLR